MQTVPLEESVETGRLVSRSSVQADRRVRLSRFSQPSRSPDAWFASGPSPYPPPPAPRVEIVPAPNPYPPPPVLSGLKLSRRHREKPWSGSLDAGIGTVADMSGSAATTSSGLSGGIGKRDIGRGTAIAGGWGWVGGHWI
jgi:hypothetical protein